MAKRWMAINLLLLVSAGLLGWQLRVSFLRFFSENDLAKIQPAQSRKQTAIQEKSPFQLAPAKNHPPNEFTTIPEKTIFSDSRSQESESETVALPDSLPLTQKPILVGVIIADNQYRALILDPAGANRRIDTKRIGDVYRGYAITGIAADHLVLESGTRKEIIPLHEGSKKGQPGKTPILSTRVVSFGGGGVSGGTPIMVPAKTVSTPRVPAATVNAPVSRSQTIVMPGAVQGRTAPPTTPVEEPTDPMQPPTTPGGTRITPSPFGDIVRPNRN